MIARTYLCLLLLLNLFGCGILPGLPQRPSLDIKLVGVWQGEYREQGGTLKSWTQTRNPDGTYSIDFSFQEPNGAISSFTEAGRWWIDGGLFHELTSSDTIHPDKYRYTFVQTGCVRFELAESEGYAEVADSYTFSECLVADSPPALFGETI
ncbi:MAG: hypothetical protein LZF61_04340 [Nitrosomonas sp.]|nr:MAG: hypothetical protein LZF61_04340 [Nitrosomonas sp.]